MKKKELLGGMTVQNSSTDINIDLFKKSNDRFYIEYKGRVHIREKKVNIDNGCPKNRMDRYFLPGNILTKVHQSFNLCKYFFFFRSSFEFTHSCASPEEPRIQLTWIIHCPPEQSPMSSRIIPPI